MRVRKNKSKAAYRRGNRCAVRLSTLNSQLSTFPSGTVLVMVVALLAMLALMATTFLVTSRYDKIATAGAGISHQMEMLLSMLEGDIRRKLAEDLWGNDAAHNNPGDPDYEAYDGPDAAHAWLKGVCGNQIGWEGNDSGYMQYVVQGDSDWTPLAGTDAKKLQFRYAVLIQDLGGLVNVNVARQPDPDTQIGGSLPATPSIADSAGWPYTIWAYHAGRGKADWGYWWYTPERFSDTDYFAGMGTPIRGGGPGAQVNLRYFLANTGELGNIDNYFRKFENYGRQFDIQDELDLRYPSAALSGAPYPSLLEATIPSLFSSSTLGGIPANRRRFVTAIARTSGWRQRHEPIRMHPYDDDFWEQSGVDENTRKLCEEEWYFRFDQCHYDDMLKYHYEAWMGHRISLQRGVTLSRMYNDDWFDIYTSRMKFCFRYGTEYTQYKVKPLCAIPNFPGAALERQSDGTFVPYRMAPPFQYDDWLTDYLRRDRYPMVQYEDFYLGDGPTMATLLLANVMATMGVPLPDKDPDDEASYEHVGFAHLAAEKTRRVKIYGHLLGAMHLNLEDYQDINTVPGLIHTARYVDTLCRYGHRAGAEDRPYVTEVVIEFEPWPDYCIIYARNYYSQLTLPVTRVDKGSGADLAGLKLGDIVIGVKADPDPDAAYVPVNTMALLRQQFRNLTNAGTDKVALKVERLVDGVTKTVDVINIPMNVAVHTIAVEVYNPHDHAILMRHCSNDNLKVWRYGVAIPQQENATTGHRALRCRYGQRNSFPLLHPNNEWSMPARSCLVYLESRSHMIPRHYVADSQAALEAMKTAYGLTGVTCSPTNHPVHYSGRDLPAGEAIYNMVNLRETDGEVLMLINMVTGHWFSYAYIIDAVRNKIVDAAGNVLTSTPMPTSEANPGTPAGIADAFAAARTRMQAGHSYPAVRLYRPMYMESRATQYMKVENSWMNGLTRTAVASRLGTRNLDGAAKEDDFVITGGYSTNYRNIDARGFSLATTNKAFRYGADLSRVTRLTCPRLKKTLPFVFKEDQETVWVNREGWDPDAEGNPVIPQAPTVLVDWQMRRTLGEIAGLSGDRDLTSRTVRQKLQKAEARLRFSPYTPTTQLEKTECSAWYNFIDAFTVGGSAYDNIDNNGNAIADEHGTHKYNLGLPTDMTESDPGGGWLPEHSNIWPTYGRINVNTAPREILENCLMAPSADIRRRLGEAVWDARGGEASQSNANYKPFKTLGDLYTRVSVMNPDLSFGFDYYGFDGDDNSLPDMPPALYAHVDELEERNYLWRINSEIITLRSDTFAVYLRFQARRYVNNNWKIISERRVYSIWDRAKCIWPPKRHDDKIHPDFVPPQRLGIQSFAY